MGNEYLSEEYFFVYKDKVYLRNSVVKLKQSYISTHRDANGLLIWNYARFHHSVIKQDGVYHMFTITNYGHKYMPEYAGYFLIKKENVELAIETMVTTNEYKDAIIVDKPPPKKDLEVEGMIPLWATYIIVLLFSFIFTQWYMIWIYASYVFFKTRAKMLRR